MNMLFDKFGNKKNPITLLDATITQEINGEYSCKIITLDEVQGQDIIELEDLNGTMQLFRLTEPNKDLETYTANGWHITQDLANDMILNRAWLATPANRAWSEFLKAGIYERRFSGECDFSKVAPLRIVRTNILEAAIGSRDNTFTNRFGGELERDNYKVNLRHRLGQDRNFSVMLGRDIVGLNIQNDFSGVFNRVIPTYLDEKNQAKMLPETYLDSPNIKMTATPITRHIHYSDIQVGAKMDDEETIPYPTEEAAIKEVRNRISELWQNKIDQPSLRLDVDFVLLYETDQYAEYKDLLKLNLGDSVTVILDDVQYKERLVMYQYDSLNKELIRAVLGKPYSEFNEIRRSINTSVSSTVQELLEQQVVQDLGITDELLGLNKAITQATGFYFTAIEAEDKTKKYYFHDKPKLEDSKYIEHYAGVGQKAYTDSGWNNGNPIWKTGQADGNLVMNIIRATVLSADQVKTGFLKSLNGDSWINLDNGSFDFGKGDLTYSRSKGMEVAGWKVTEQGFETTVVQNAGIRFSESDYKRIEDIIRKNVVASPEDFARYDLNGDGKINVVDLTYLEQIVKGERGQLKDRITNIKLDPYTSTIEISTEVNSTDGNTYLKNKTKLDATSINAYSLTAGNNAVSAFGFVSENKQGLTTSVDLGNGKRLEFTNGILTGM